MSQAKSDYYVYVYIDPRNYEEFYYGKGKGNRKVAHEKDKSNSEKARRIRDIYKENCRPIIRVIARDLTEQEALLIETTLIWKLSPSLLNEASGRFVRKFRPKNKVHLPLSGFDFRHGIYYVNIGEGPHRCWEDCRRFGFIAAGQGTHWSNQLQKLNVDDIVVAYVKQVTGHGPRGYVGIGKVTTTSQRVLDFRVNGKKLNKKTLKVQNLFENSHNDKSEHLVGVEWFATTDRDAPKWQANSGLFTPAGKIVASLEKHLRTVRFVENNFDIMLSEI